MDTHGRYYGGNLDLLRKHIPDQSVDLVYLNPPFDSNRTYSAIFADEGGWRIDPQSPRQSQHDGLGLIVDAVRAALASTPTQRRAGRVEPTRSDERPASVCRRLASLGTFGDIPTRRTTAPGGNRWP